MDPTQDGDLSEINPDDLTDREVFFALMAVKMMRLSQKYNRKLEDLHNLFY
jgi:hypothetical protein